MSLCEQNVSAQEHYRERPFAVPFGWMMLGAMLMTCNCIPVVIVGTGLVLWSLPSIIRRLGTAACCMRRKLSDRANGEVIADRHCYF